MKVAKNTKPVPGPVGPVGPAGAAGLPYTIGTGDPTLVYTQTTAIGDRYMDGATGSLWERVAFANQLDPDHIVLLGNLTWKKVAGLRGPAGANGANGANGAAGAQGPQGPQGPAGQNLQLITKPHANIDGTKNEVLEGNYDFDGTGATYANFLSLRSADGTKGGEVAIAENFKMYFVAPQPAGSPSFWKELVSKDLNSYGYRFSEAVMLPNLTTAEINAILYPEAGQMVFNTDLDTLCFHNGTSWQKVTSTAM